jgi:hypothetical protein
MIQAVNRGLWYRPLYYNNLTHFWDKVDIVYVMHLSDVTLLFEQWNIFKNLQFILLFLNIWTLTFHSFRLKNAFHLVLGFRFSKHCWAFQSLFWLSKLPSNHSATVITLLFYIISIFDLIVGYFIVGFVKIILTICLKKQYTRHDTSISDLA